MNLRTPLLFAAPFALAAVPAWALADSRVRMIAYDPAEVVAVAVREGFQSSIVFGDDEKVENVAVGDSLGWQVTPNKRANVLFLKPVAHNTLTNMTVVTDRRVYLFDLVPSGRGNPPVYSMRFAYTDAAPPSTRVPANPAPAAIPAEGVADMPVHAPVARVPSFNFAWKQQGDRSVLPTHVFDDGQAVYLDWDRKTPLPAILAVGGGGEEGPVNFSVRGDTIVVDGVAAQLVLRAGKARATLTNESASKPEAAHGPAALAEPASADPNAGGIR